MRGDADAARAWAWAAAASYPHCPKPRLALGAMLLDAGRARAALRHYEAALAVAIDDDDAWEAAVNGGLCVVELLRLRKSLCQTSIPLHQHGELWPPPNILVLLLSAPAPLGVPA